MTVDPADRGVAEWDETYGPDGMAPWDIRRPQPAFAALAERGLLTGRLLDAGCGTGEQSLLAAAHGAEVTGIDVAARAIAQARRKAAERGLAIRFESGDALDLPALRQTFETAVDSGLFHVFDDPARARYVASLAAVLEPGATVHLMCFSDRQPGDWGPRRVREDELRAAFAAGWEITDLAAAEFEIKPVAHGAPVAQAWLAAIRRSSAPG